MAMRVAWLKDLRMADLARVGGKNASLGEMIGGLAARRHPRARRLRHHRRGLPRVPRRTTASSERIARAPREARSEGRQGARRVRHGDPRLDPRERRFPPRSSRRYGRSIKQLESRPRAMPRSPCAPPPRPRTCPTRRSPASRRPSSTSAASTTCSRRSGTSSPRSTTTAPSPTACTRASRTPTVALSAGVQRMVRSDLGAAGVMFTLDTESGFRDVVFITSAYGLGEMVVQGAVNPDEFYVHKPCSRTGKPAIVRRALGSKRRRWCSAQPAQAGQARRATVDVPEAERDRFSLTDAEVAGAGALRGGDREALRPADGHRVGQGRHRRQALRPAGAARDGEVAQARRRGALRA